MNNIFGITGIRTRSFQVEQNDTREVNAFLKEHDGNIIDIQIVTMLCGYSRWVIIYKKVED